MFSSLRVSFNPPASAESIPFANICPKPARTTLGRGFLRSSMGFRGLSSVSFHTFEQQGFFSSPFGGPCLPLHTQPVSSSLHSYLCVYLTFHLLFFSRRPGGELFEGSALGAPAQLDSTVSLLLYPDCFSHKLHKHFLSFVMQRLRVSNLTFKCTFQMFCFFLNLLCTFPADRASC